IPVAMISTSTSPAFGPSRSTSTISSGCLGAKATAARVFMSRCPQNGMRLAIATGIPFGQDECMGRELEGRHALITGGGTGIGAAAAQHLNAAGAKLSLLGRRMEPLLAVAEGLGGSAIGCDVTEPEQIANAFDEARTLNGPIDLLVVN